MGKVTTLKIAAWNIDGLAPNKNEVESLLILHNIDILLVSETHFTKRSSINIKNYNIYRTDHPDGTAHGGTAILIKKSIKHHEALGFKTNHIQATTVLVEDNNKHISISSVYCPPKHIISESQFSLYLNSLGQHFIAGGDWNAKHVHWGSRLITTRGRELKKSVENLHLTTLATPEPTHWPTDRKRLPDVLDFFVLKGLSGYSRSVKSCLDGSSGHTPVILQVSNMGLKYDARPMLYNRRTDWESFRELVEDRLCLKIALKNKEEIEAATTQFERVVQSCCWSCTPETTNLQPKRTIPDNIRAQILEKRRLRRIWHNSRHPEDKRAFNKAAKELKVIIDQVANDTASGQIESLTATSATNYSLWKACKNADRPVAPKPPLRKIDGSWARTAQEKADMFAAHLSKIFTPNDPDPEADNGDIERIMNEDALQPDTPIKPTSPREVLQSIKDLDNNKAPGFDLIDKKVLCELPRKAFVFITMLFNAILRIGYFPALLKVSQVIMMEKQGKPRNELTSYRPISLLPILSKLFERILLRRLMPIISEQSIIPDHQFGFRQEHATIEQIHRVCQTIRNALERKEYCSAAFLDIQQAFDRVWHKGLLYKIKLIFPQHYYKVLESYLSDRIFQVREGECTSAFYGILAGVPQGSVLGPVLYTIYTHDLPQSPLVKVATFADDTAILASDVCHVKASQILQKHLNAVERWLKQWRIRVSSSKSIHITFTLRREDCPPVHLCNQQLPHKDTVKYLGMHLDRRLTWRNHIEAKRDQLNTRFRELYWLVGRNTKLSLDNKLLIYKTILKPIWTYGIQLWGSASNSNICMIQRAEDSILKRISNAPWFIRNSEVHRHLQINTVKEEIDNHTSNYKHRLLHHPNKLAAQLVIPDEMRRLKRRHILELAEPE